MISTFQNYILTKEQGSLELQEGCIYKIWFLCIKNPISLVLNSKVIMSVVLINYTVVNNIT